MIERIKQLIQRLLSAPSANEKHSIIILLASILALTLWFLVTLNQEYGASVRFPVKITNIPQTIEIKTETQPEIELVIKGGGVDLMVEYFKFNRDTLEFAFNEEYLRNKYIPTSFYRDGLTQKFPFEIRGITPGRIYFDFENKVYKRVPLYSRTEFKLAPAFYLENDPKLSPDSVTILGPQRRLDSITEWYTSYDQTNLIEKNEEIEIPVSDSISGLTVTPKFVKATIRPKMYTQADLKIPITVFDVPVGASIRLGEDSLNISCLVPMADYEAILEESKSYKAPVSFYDLDPSLSHVIPQPKLPESIKLVEQHPFRVSFVIVNK